jgi:hypothetical protein
MKTTNYKLRKLLMSLCLLIGIGITSCQLEEEIIDITEEDIITGDALDEFDPEKATRIVIDNNGNITGYLDNDYNLLDLNGNRVSYKNQNSRDDSGWSDLLMVMYYKENFKGTNELGTMIEVHASSYSPNGDFIFHIPHHKLINAQYQWSFVIPPNVDVTFSGTENRTNIFRYFFCSILSICISGF